MKRFLRFLLVGGLGFLIDAGITQGLVALGLHPALARLPALALAMAFTWLANRRFTYGVQTARSLGEGGRYAMVALGMAMLNYLAYLLLVRQGLWPALAVTIATAAQTVLSFHAYRVLVFRNSGTSP